ncbi:PVR cell adhesion molecule related 2 like isoform X1 [Esox lucius]|uniref:Ig-like domain-containing protein n=1 Tax=Esox lucius TaxID=8010 RepID=A0A3P8YYP4_ESOLU|nr:PVR cell adhesion molecule related 2 like isoform X1 [Esox lucius]
MARDYVKRCPLSSTKNCCFVTAAILLIIQAASCQRVKVVPEVEAYPTASVDLRCQFVQGGDTKLTQVSWIWEPVEGQRDNIAVFHPTYGESFPPSPFNGRVSFVAGSLNNPSITITNLTMSDAGRFTCEYATYPIGNAQGTTNLVMLAKSKNSAHAVTVQASSDGRAVVVARCVAADAKPAANINWLGLPGGTENITAVQAPNHTVTVTSEYQLAPTASDNGKELTCIVSQRIQGPPQSFTVKLSIEYLPSVTIVGYDQNWYIGRTDAVLTCQADGNPAPTAVTWSAVSGPMPDTVQIDDNKLIVRKVDESVNTTFVCEVKNRLGVSKNQVTTTVIEAVEDPSNVGVLAGAIIGSLLALLLVGALIAVLVTRSRRQRRGYPGNGEPGSYSNKVRLFGGAGNKNGGPGANNNGPVYTYRESDPGPLVEKGNDFLHRGPPGPAPTAHDILLSSELDEAERRKFDALDDSLEEEEEERYDSFGVGMAPAYHIHRHDEEMGGVSMYLDDDMESQRDGSVISRTAIYV